MNSAATLTVLLTVYNGMPYLQEAVHSILGQTIQDFTFLVLDNGSTDGSGEWLETITDPRLRLERLPATISRTDVLNKALGMVSTELVAIIDADDIAAPRRLELQRNFMQQNPGVDLVGSDIVTINAQGERTGTQQFPPEHEALCNRLPLYNQFAHAACMFRTAKAKAVGGYPTTSPYAQDLALWLAMIQAGSRVASLPQPLASIRVHPAQATKDPAQKMARAEDTLRLAKATLALPGLSRAAHQAGLVRLAFAHFALHQNTQGRSILWQALRLAPLQLFTNPILWERIMLERQRHKKK